MRRRIAPNRYRKRFLTVKENDVKSPAMRLSIALVLLTVNLLFVANLMGLPTDCPQRDERLGWLGDAHVTAEEAMFNFDMALFYEKWLNDIKSTQRVQNGDIPYISPRPFTDGAGTPAWSSAYHLIVWYMYLYYGDKHILDDHYESMRSYVNYLTSTADNHILPSDNSQIKMECLSSCCLY